MTTQRPIIGRGTKIRVAPVTVDRIFPEAVVFTVSGVAPVAAATSITITVAPAITRTITAPFWVNFVETSGKSHLVKVTADVEVGDTTLTVSALKEGIAAGATANYPVILANRTSANLTDQDAEADVMTFENNGWKDQITTILGNGLDLSGFYSPTDAGWNICWYARQNFSEIFCEMEMRPPDSRYTKGMIVRMISGVKMPIEAPPDNIVNTNITLMSRGPVVFIDPT